MLRALHALRYLLPHLPPLHTARVPHDSLERRSHYWRGGNIRISSLTCLRYRLLRLGLRPSTHKRPRLYTPLEASSNSTRLLWRAL